MDARKELGRRSRGSEIKGREGCKCQDTAGRSGHREQGRS